MAHYVFNTSAEFTTRAGTQISSAGVYFNWLRGAKCILGHRVHCRVISLRHRARSAAGRVVELGVEHGFVPGRLIAFGPSFQHVNSCRSAVPVYVSEGVARQWIPAKRAGQVTAHRVRVGDEKSKIPPWWQVSFAIVPVRLEGNTTDYTIDWDLSGEKKPSNPERRFAKDRDGRRIPPGTVSALTCPQITNPAKRIKCKKDHDDGSRTLVVQVPASGLGRVNITLSILPRQGS